MSSVIQVSLSQTTLRSDQKLFLVAGVLTAILWALPLVRPFLLPLTFLNTHVHELWHAIAAIFTGGSAEHIKVFADGSGVTPIQGGFLPVIASAGYVGSSLLGAVLILLTRTQRGARLALRFLGLILAVGMMLWVRGDWVGVCSGLFWVMLLLGLGFRLKGNAAIFTAQFLGLQQCLTSFQSVFDLVLISAQSGQHSDAKLMSEAFLLPPLFWALAWSLISLVLVAITMRSALSVKTRIVKPDYQTAETNA